MRAAPGLHSRRLLARTLFGGLALVALTAAPAAADAAGPSDFRSEVTRITPSVDGVHAEIRGGDSFLEVRVDEGHEVIVDGYSGEPYLRFRVDGTIERNTRSSATYINDDRKGKGTIPAEAKDAEAEPVWEEVGAGGSYAWHDHRVHWMQSASPSVERGERVPGAYDPWRVPIEVDGTAAEVQGTLTYESAPSPIPFVALLLLAGGGLARLGRGRGLRIPAVALAALSGLAVVVGRADFSSGPGGNPLLWALPVAALAAAVVAGVTRGSPSVIGTLASVALLSGWGLFRGLDVFTKPVLPTELPFWFDRATTAMGMGIAIAAAYLAVTSGQLQLAPLDDD